MSCKKTSIGGQALMEGVMMRGPYKSAMAVRNPKGEIVIEEVKADTLFSGNITKIPFLRGIFALISSLKTGSKALTRSADIAYEGIDDEEPSKFEKWLTERFGKKLFSVVAAIGSVLGVVLGVALFMILPTYTYAGLKALFALMGAPVSATTNAVLQPIFEGFLRIAIFLVYLVIITRMKEIRRVFQYHGAEHKTIFCYEAEEELIPENVRKYKRFHPRCGTSFMFLMILVGIIAGILLRFIPGVNLLPNYLWIAIKILLIPLFCGVGYELIKFTGRHDNILTKIIAAPGLWVQRLTTFEPDDSQIECAIAALKEVIPEDGSDQW
jgi:uncharacterized protein YqhQ